MVNSNSLDFKGLWELAKYGPPRNMKEDTIYCSLQTYARNILRTASKLMLLVRAYNFRRRFIASL